MNQIASIKKRMALPIWVAIPVALIVLGNIGGWLGVGLHTDEAYYWVWSQRIDWGYYDHPPMIAWMVRLFTDVFGNNLLAIRLPAVIAWSVSSYVVFLLGKDLFKSRLVGWLSLLVFISLPIFQIGFHVIGPDAPLMLFTALACLFVYRATLKDVNHTEWVQSGLVVGLAMLSKYTAVLVPAAIFIALLLSPAGRRQLRTPWPWLAGVLAVGIFSPVVVWNAQNEWASFLFQWGHGTATNKGFAFSKIETYVLQQMSSVLPWMFIGMIVASIQLVRKRTELNALSLRFLVIMFWFPILFFGVTGSISKSMHNWPIIAYLPGSVLLAGWLGQWIEFPGNRPARWSLRSVKYGLVLSACIALLLVNLIRFPQWAMHTEKQIIPKGSAVAAVWGWGQLGSAAKKLIQTEKRWDSKCRIRVVADHNNAHLGYYHAAGELAYQLGNADLVSVDPVRHFRQYNLWQNLYRTNGYKDCLLMIGPSYSARLPDTVMGADRKYWYRKSIVNIEVPDRSIQRYAFYGVSKK